MKLRSILALVVLFLALPGWSAVPMTKLRIEVRKASSLKPVEQASVIVRFVAGRSAIKLGKSIRTTYQLKTGIDGNATVPSIPQGKILVQINAKGYQTFGAEFVVSEEEKTIEIKLNEPQSQFSAH